MEGRALDALVAERVMGLNVQPCRSINEPLAIANAAGSFERFIPRYSTDIATAWMVVEKLQYMSDRDGEAITSCSVSQESTGWRCELTCEQAAWIQTAETAPLAICLAALKALGVEVPA